MGLVRSCVCSLAVLMFASAAFGVEARHELYVIQTKPPAVVIVDAEQGAIVGKIPIKKYPTKAIADSSGRFLYVLQGHQSFLGATKAAQLSIVDLEKRHVDRVIQLKRSVDSMQLSRDGRTLFCFSNGNSLKPHPKSRDDASITAIDTASQQVKNVYRISTPASGIIMTRDGSRIFAFSSSVYHGMSLGAFVGKPALEFRYPSEQMTVFSNAQKQPLVTVDLHRFYPTRSAFSPKQKLLFLLGERHKLKGRLLQKGGTLDVVDVETGKILHTYTVVQDPLRLVRLAHQPGLWIVGKDEMQFVSQEGVLSPERIMLDGKSSEGNLKLGGLPGDMLLLPGNKMAVSVLNDKGNSDHRLAVLDVKEQKVVRLVHVGKEGVRAGKRAAHIALAVGLSAASYGAASGVGAPSFIEFLPGFDLSHAVGLAKSADGKYFYALDGASNDITVVKSADDTIAGHIHVDSSSFMLWMAKGSHYLFCVSAGKVFVIDTDTNKLQAEYKLTGYLRDGEVDPATAELSVLTNKELEIWGSKDGKHVASIPELDHALLIVRKGGITQ